MVLKGYLFGSGKIMVDADMRKMGLEPVGEGNRILREKFPEKWWAVD